MLGATPYGWEYPYGDSYATLQLPGALHVNSVQTYEVAALAGLLLLQSAHHVGLAIAQRRAPNGRSSYLLESDKAFCSRCRCVRILLAPMDQEQRNAALQK
jgi:hypothetical protein